MTPIQAFCRAEKAALDRLEYLLAHTSVSRREAFEDAAYLMHTVKAGRLWHRLPATVRAAVLNPDRRES